MPGVYLDFKVRVVETYQRMRVQNKLSDRLKRSSPAKLREECIRVYNQRFARKDEKILREFFEYEGEIDHILRRIEAFSADKFKPLDNFLKGKTGESEDKNIDLLAWLIGFEKRPYNDREDYTVAKYDNLVPETESGEDTEASYKGQPYRSTTNSGKESPSGIKRLASVFLLVLIPIITIIVYKWKTAPPLKSSVNGADCMYWAYDHYEPSTCIQRGGDTDVIPLDPVRLRNFRRITDTTLITVNSIGKVWYRINDGKFEFYTAQGYHPVDRKGLRRLTEKSYDKYLR